MQINSRLVNKFTFWKNIVRGSFSQSRDQMQMFKKKIPAVQLACASVQCISYFSLYYPLSTYVQNILTKELLRKKFAAKHLYFFLIARLIVRNRWTDLFSFCFFERSFCNKFVLIFNERNFYKQADVASALCLLINNKSGGRFLFSFMHADKDEDLLFIYSRIHSFRKLII